MAILIEKIKKATSDVAECVQGVSRIVHAHPESLNSNCIEMLVACLTKLETGAARASVFWIVSMYCREELVEGAVHDTLRIAARDFAKSCIFEKLAIVLLAARVGSHLHNDELVQKLVRYIMDQAQLDLSIDLRDRARFYIALEKLDCCKDVLFQRDTVTVFENPFSGLSSFTKRTKCI